jgi:hypothetical protein
MKKITFLLLTVLPLLGFGQTITNTTFDTDVSGWVSNGTGASISWNPTEGSAAAGSLELISDSDGDRAQTSPNVPPFDGPGNYELTFQVKGPVGVDFQAAVFQSSSGGFNGGPVFTLTGGWDTYPLTTYSGLDGGNMNIRLIAKGAGTFYIDDVSWAKEACVGFEVLALNDGGGTVAITNEQPCYPTGTDVELTATPNTTCGFTFDQWEINGTPSGISTNPFTFTVGTEDAEIKALFSAPVTAGDTNYDTDAELSLWTASNSDSTVSVASNDLTWSWTTVVTPKIIYGGCTIAPDSWNLNAARIGYTNNSVNDVIRLRVLGANGDQNFVPANAFMTENGSGEAIIPLVSPSAFIDYPAELELQVKKDDGSGNNLDAQPGNIVLDYVEFYFDPALGTSEFLAYEFSMFPNPTKGHLNLNYQGTIQKVQIFDITGKTVIETGAFINSTQVNISNLNQGIYLVKLTDESSNSAIKKLIVN